MRYPRYNFFVDLEILGNKLKEFGISSFMTNEQSEKFERKIPLRYEPFSLAYQRAYNVGTNYREVSSYSSDRNLIYWPLIVSKNDSKVSISSDGMKLFPPIFLSPKPSQSTYQRIQMSCFGLIEKLSQQYEIAKLEIRPDFLSDSHPWLEHCVNTDRKMEINFEDVLRLESSSEDLFNALKDSTRRDIIKGLEQFDIELLEGEDASESFTMLRELHQLVSGRITRDLATWKIQESNLRNNRALLILCREKGEVELISASYFEFNSLEAVYGVSATQRNFFSSPINHAMQWKAIEYFNSRAISYYRLGQRYNGIEDEPKLQNISKFKRKFSSHFESIITIETN